MKALRLAVFRDGRAVYEIAAKAGMHRSTLFNYLAGHRVPDAEAKKRLKKVMPGYRPPAPKKKTKR